MRLRKTELFGATAIAGSALISFACSGGEDYPPFPSGTGGTASSSTGGNPTSTGGVTSTGGTLSTGGFAPNTGGFSTGGTTGGKGGFGTTGGSSTGGSSIGNTGGKSSTGGKGGFGTTGGSATGTGGKGGLGTTGGSSTGTGGKGSTGGSGGKSGSTGGSNAGGSGGAGSVAFSQVASYVRSKCGSCHTAARMPNLSSTDNAALYTTLTTATVARCANNKLATAGDPSKSALLMVSTGQCGTLRMPQGCTSTAQCISTADQTLLTNWIQSGAKNP